jgi:hypothetical protein
MTKLKKEFSELQ